MYCFISNDILNIEIIQCLGYDWKKNDIFNMINIPINHHNPNQFFLRIILGVEISIWIISIPNDINNPTGYTQSNLVKALLSVSARIAKILSVGVQITVSQSVKKIHNIIMAFANEKNIISARVFLFSTLLILEKNIHIQIREATKIPTKWILKLFGLNIFKKVEKDDGI